MHTRDVPVYALWPNAHDSVESIARSVVSSRVAKGTETAFYVVDLDAVANKLRLWNEVLPRIRPHYAVKCNPNPVILNALVEYGIGFDCATRAEMELMMSLGAKPSDIIYAHTIKPPSSLRFAKAHNITRTTFDNLSELEKIKANYPSCSLMLRLRVVETDVFNMTDKFGCHLDEVPALLKRAKELQLNIEGFSFHVGFNSQDPKIFKGALRMCKEAEKEAFKLGLKPKLIDIGGGFECHQETEPAFREIAAVIREESDKLFPASEGYEVVSEPGTFFVGSAMTLCAPVLGKRVFRGTTHLHLHDSIYTSFMLVQWTNTQLQVQTFNSDTTYTAESAGDGLVPTRIYGCSCAGVDRILDLWQLPDIDVGDWLMFHNQGAYSEAIETDFNMLEKPDRFYQAAIPSNREIVKRVLKARGDAEK